MFNTTRLEIARQRRRLTSKALAERAGISPVTLSRVTQRVQFPDENTVDALIAALDFPRDFFFLDDVEAVDAVAASFRSLTSMTAAERDAALSAGVIAFELLDWVKSRFELPSPDLPNLGDVRDPAQAARLVREHWGIGEKPIGHLIKLLESKGVRVFSLSEDTKRVDAFSCWHAHDPFIFLNTFKSAERSRFDAAHELGHLVLHRHGGPQGREAEHEANGFASAFLMPHVDLVSNMPSFANSDQILRMKKRWGVSAVALAYRLNKIGLMTEWQYIQVNRQYRTSEPQGMLPERSAVWKMVLTELWKDGVAREHIARSLNVPISEIESLLFGLTGESDKPLSHGGPPNLRVV
jgi:Zn-dependent peptidase ImmA (M78 family)